VNVNSWWGSVSVKSRPSVSGSYKTLPSESGSVVGMVGARRRGDKKPSSPTVEWMNDRGSRVRPYWRNPRWAEINPEGGRAPLTVRWGSMATCRTPTPLPLVARVQFAVHSTNPAIYVALLLHLSVLGRSDETSSTVPAMWESRQQSSITIFGWRWFIFKTIIFIHSFIHSFDNSVIQ